MKWEKAQSNLSKELLNLTLEFWENERKRIKQELLLLQNQINEIPKEQKEI